MPRIALIWIVCMASELHLTSRNVAAETPAAAAKPARWLAHDMTRPHPPVVTPGKQSLPAAPPSDAIVLFDGSDLSKWRAADGSPAKWKARDGYMESVPLSGYLVSADKFGDVQLHIEWATPTPARGRSQGRGNSGVFLMSLYEVQVLDSYENETYADGQAGAIYGQYPPLANACLPPGEWQAFDISFRRPRFHEDGTLARAARMTVLHNGVLVQDAVELWGPTTWMQNLPYTSHAERLPISLQDHGNPVRYRNIWLRELVDPVGPEATELPPRNVISLPASALEKFVGAYGNLLGPMGEIVLVDGQLQFRMKTGQVIDLLPLSDNEFALRWTAAKVEFDVKDPDEVAGFTLHLAGDKQSVRKLPQDKQQP
ncbi:MAG: family 16 glycoside hydrolase [Pirellulales bacterium]